MICGETALIHEFFQGITEKQDLANFRALEGGQSSIGSRFSFHVLKSSPCLSLPNA